MGVKGRLSPDALLKILKGNINREGEQTLIVKFYSTSCHLCRELKTVYAEVASQPEFKDISFYAFNIGDDPGMPKRLKFRGIPTIYMIKVKKGFPARYKKLGEPKKPHKKTWYTSMHITDFIEKEK